MAYDVTQRPPLSEENIVTADDQTARSQRIVEVMRILEHLHPQVNAENADLLDRAMRVIGALDDNAPVLPHTELSVAELRARGASHYRRALQGPLEYIQSLFHGEVLLHAGEQWTLSFGTTCGFTMDFTIRLKAPGDCVSVPDEYMKGDALHHAGDPDPEQENLDDLNAADFNTLLQELGLRKIPPPKKPRRSRKQKDAEHDN